ncbi:helix-turn-helix domain-containing protein [Azorhizophilus paspali]|uniref:helix-turn-helix domain-containing protein n=1 Tax=Azorhizophilus paspali TaxID=69963 RepID=UPI00363D4605
MILAHKIALAPNNAQATYFARAAGVARFAYNWALAEWGRQYEAHKADPAQPRPSQAALRRQLNAIKREQFPGCSRSPRTPRRWPSSSSGRRSRTSSPAGPGTRGCAARACMTASP